MGDRGQSARAGPLDRRELLQRAGVGAAALAAGASGLGAAEAVGGAQIGGAIGRRQLRELRRAVNGPVLTPGSTNYDTARLLFNERFDGIRPPAVVQVRGVGDVKAVMRWANRHDIRVTARCGGHSYGGYSTTRGGVVIDVRRLRRVDAGRGAPRATIGAGVPLSGMYSRLTRQGITVPGGTCPTVGITGLALGGGVGFASRKYGLTSDNIRAIGIVTPDGRFREATARNHRDLFWACRGGGGGNFGVVTYLTFRTHPAPPAAYFHGSWPWAQADAVLDAWQNLVPFAPDELMSVLGLTSGKEEPKVRANGQFFGTETALKNLIKPLTEIEGAKVKVGTESYGDLMLRWAGCQGETAPACREGAARTAFYGSSDYAADPLDSVGRARMLEAIEAGEPLHEKGGTAQMLLDSYGGAIERLKPTATAFVHRDQLYDIQYITRFEGGGRAAADGWIRSARRLMRRHVSGQSYQNYIDPKLRGWKRAYYGENLERLIDVKTRIDPDNRLRFRQGIPTKS